MGAATSREGDAAARAAAREHTKRCRERRRLMREAVRLRRHLAASHAAYLRSLGVVASALTRFAVGEPLPVSDHTPPAVVQIVAHRLAVVAPSSPPPLLRAVVDQDQPPPPQREELARGSGGVGVAAAAATARTVGVGGGGGAGEAEEEMRMVVRHRSLAEVAAGLEEYFVKASVAGDTVSGLLEASTTELNGGSSHSFLGALCCLSAPAVDRVDSMSSSRQRHSATLQQLLAWEKKLYKDVKAREKLQIRHDKALAELWDQEYSLKIDVDIQKLKSSWERARAQLEAASQSVHATSSSISRLRDTHLARQLLEICHATLDTWRAARTHHEAQSAFAQQLRGLSSRTSMDPTTEIHHQATRALEAAMSAWSAALAHLARHHRDYVHAVHAWLKLTLTPPVSLGGGAAGEEDEEEGSAAAVDVAVELAAFVERWGKVLDRVHCVEVIKAIKGFAGAVRGIHALQSDELRVARRVRRYSRELDRKSRMLRQVEKSYYDSYGGLPGGMMSSMWHWGWGRPAWRDQLQAREAGDEVAQRRDEIAACRKAVEDEMRRHAKAIDATRTATVTGVQGKLPAVFQTMAAYSASLASSLEAACRAPQQNANMQ